MPSFDLPPAPEKLSAWDADQLLNTVIGINKSVDGVKQLYTEMKESLGLVPAGTARYETQLMKEQQKLMAEDAGVAPQRPGAGFAEGVGETLPYLAVPLGNGIKAGAVIGAAIGAAGFQENVDDSRVPGMLIGGALGGVFGKLLNRPIAKQIGRELGVQKMLPAPQKMLEAPAKVSTVGDVLPRIARSAESRAPRLNGPAVLKALEDKGIIYGQDAAKIEAAAAKLSQMDAAYVQKAASKVVQRNKELSDAFTKMESTLKEAKIAKDTPRAERIQNKLDELRRTQIAGNELERRFKAMTEVIDSPAVDTMSTLPQDVIRNPNRMKQIPTKMSGNPSRFGRGQAGEIDPKLMASIAGAGVGAAVGGSTTDSPLGAVGGALLGFAAVPAAISLLKWNGARAVRKASEDMASIQKEMGKLQKAGAVTKETYNNIASAVSKGMDDFLGAVDTRISMISQPIAAALRNTEYLTHYRSGAYIKAGEPFFDKLSSSALSEKQLRSIKGLLSNDRRKAVTKLREYGAADAADELENLGGVLDDVAKYLKENGLGENIREGYFPRRVIDATRFDSIPEVHSYFQHIADKKKVSSLTDFQKEKAITELLNETLTGKVNNNYYSAAAKSLKQRKLNTVDDSIVDAYADPREAFNGYIEEIVKHVETQRFFKGQGVKDAMRPNAENMSNITDKMRKALIDGKMDMKEAEEVTELLNMRFGPGEQAPSKFVQNYKNLTYTGLLGNPLSAVTQIGDLALSMYKNDIGNTSRALIMSLTKRGRASGSYLDKDTLLGLRDAAQDFAGSEISSRKVLDWALSRSGFKAMDKLGKNTFINAAMMKNQQLSKADFIQKWSPWFEGETEMLFKDVQDFAKNGLTNQNRERIGHMLWNSLSEVQPISLSAMPKKYLEHPNGRMFYMLQSFTLRMFNTIRQDIKHEINRGNYKTAMKNMSKLGSYFILMNGSTDMLKDFMLGRDQRSLPDTVLNNTLKLAGVNKFILDDVGRSGLGGAAMKVAGPPTAPLDALTNSKAAVGMLPLAGRFLKETMQ